MNYNDSDTILSNGNWITIIPNSKRVVKISRESKPISKTLGDMIIDAIKDCKFTVYTRKIENEE